MSAPENIVENIEIRLLLEGIFQRYGIDFSPLRAGLAQAPDPPLCPR